MSFLAAVATAKHLPNLKAKNNRGLLSHLAIALQKWVCAALRTRTFLKNEKPRGIACHQDPGKEEAINDQRDGRKQA